MNEFCSLIIGLLLEIFDRLDVNRGGYLGYHILRPLIEVMQHYTVGSLYVCCLLSRTTQWQSVQCLFLTVTVCNPNHLSLMLRLFLTV